MPTPVAKHPSSYRDPSGFVFEKDGALYRQINSFFREDFDHFMINGCYEDLVKKELLIPHIAIAANLTADANWYATIQPEKINFISYPYEWSFDMLKDAALLTLKLVNETIPFGVLLKDATPYNIQWYRGKLIFIDTLSFEKYDETKPWIAYRQFCENFLGPLLLMHYTKVPLQQLLLAYPDGMPLPVIKSLLPWRSRFSLYTYLHIFLHAKISSDPKSEKTNRGIFSKGKLLNLISSLETLIRKLTLPNQDSAWSGYYVEASARKDYLEEKKKIVSDWVKQLPGTHSCSDLGANEGEFSYLTAGMNIPTIAADADPFCINKLYQKIKLSGEKNIQPLVLDLSNPSPAIGVNNKERNTFSERAERDLVMALALLHHLAIGKNIPLDRIADFFRPLAKNLIIEFIPKEDEKIQLMLKTKKDIFYEYKEENFEIEFKRWYTIEKKQAIANSGRILYLLKRI